MIADVIEPFFGINCSGGIGIGKIVKIREKTFASTGVMGKSDPENEVKRLQSAIALYRDLNDKLSRQVDNDLGVRNGDIIRSYLVILDDPEMNELFLKFIRSGRSAEESVSEVCKIFSDMFGRIDDPVISQKKTDIEDIRQTLIGILSGDLGDDREFEKDTVIVGRNITPSLVSKLENGNVVGIVSENGNETSHSAILAKCLKIPMISGVNGIYDSVFDNDTVIVDALDGLVVLAPDEDEYEFYKRKQKEYLLKQRELEEYISKDTVFSDGSKFSIMCNITGSSDIRKVLESGGEGIGLYRTEFLFMNSKSVPSEEEQFKVYKKVVEDVGDRKAIIRTLDIGGDKSIPCLELPVEDNPFLGLRGIRLCFREKDILRTQLRALIRASAYGNLGIMFPMITDIDELLDLKALITQIHSELDAEGIPFSKDMEIGCMIETPSSVIISKELARECDFFSIGTNDLIQYVMCADRGNAGVSYLYSAYYPAVLRMIAEVVKSASECGISVSVCGEAAGDERLLPFFAGIGIRSLSVTPDKVLELKKAFLSMDSSRFAEIAQKVLSLSKEHEIMSYLCDIQ